jgi:choline dehydrogenase-like flavoprotein
MSSPNPDPIAAGLQRGWKIHGPNHRPFEGDWSCDVAIIGSGAGAGITAELLTRAGLDVVIVEEGPLRSSRDFRQLESEAYPSLYQESAARKTRDKAINILQGRCVGGSTTVNWTSSFRTPSVTLQQWRQAHGLGVYTDELMAPWFERVERRLHIAPWQPLPNANNEVLAQGGRALNIPVKSIPRNVRACWNLGSCGMGCPTNAKQSMLVTTLPTALDAGARLLVDTQVELLQWQGQRVQALVCHPMQPDGEPDRSRAWRITARHVVLAGGAIQSPAVLLRSKAPDPHERLGRRTFLHPVVIASAVFEQRIEGWAGAPQSLYSDHFLDTLPPSGPIGYKLEAAPLHPVIFASTTSGYGADYADAMRSFAHRHAMLALMRDGFHPESVGGTVRLRSDGTPELDYPLNAYVLDGARRAFLSMAELQFAAGAKVVDLGHEQALPCKTWAQAQAQVAALDMKPLLTKVVSAHVMGGCAMGGDERQGVVRPDGVHWQLENLSVHDGSLFPTSIGANPQESIYGLTALLSTRLAERLGARTPSLAEPA